LTDSRLGDIAFLRQAADIGVCFAFEPYRHLESLLYETRGRRVESPRLGVLAVAPPAAPGVSPPEFSWRDYVVMLLHVAAEIGHSLMVEYLLSPYAFGGPQGPSRLRKAPCADGRKSSFHLSSGGSAMAVKHLRVRLPVQRPLG
jgi:hypothetical protein